MAGGETHDLPNRREPTGDLQGRPPATDTCCVLTTRVHGGWPMSAAIGTCMGHVAALHTPTTRHISCCAETSWRTWRVVRVLIRGSGPMLSAFDTAPWGVQPSLLRRRWSAHDHPPPISYWIRQVRPLGGWSGCFSGDAAQSPPIFLWQVVRVVSL
jgi:hypothetical protein